VGNVIQAVETGLLRRGVVALCEYACGYDAGRGKSDPVYREVSEDEHGVPRAHYSSCADLGHWLLWRMGVRDHRVNRNANGGWRPIVNISLLCSLGLTAGVGENGPGEDFAFGAGDILIIANNWPMGGDAHCQVLLAVGAGTARTGNYGAGGMSAAEFPGARISSGKFVFDGKLWRSGLRAVRRVITVADMQRLAAAPADWSGAALTGEELDALDGRLVTP
jgi:hypothetical protein